VEALARTAAWGSLNAQLHAAEPPAAHQPAP
jgi:hypothetical protein